MYPPEMTDGGGDISGLMDLTTMYFEYPSSTSVRVTVKTVGGYPGSYGFEIVPVSSSFNNTLTSSSNPYFTVTGLTAGATYKVQARAFSGINKTGDEGSMLSKEFTLPKTDNSGTIISTSQIKEYDEGVTSGTLQKVLAAEYDEAFRAAYAANTNVPVVPGQKDVHQVSQTTRSLFKLTRKTNTTNKVSVAFRQFNNLNTNQTYYAFGTSMFFDATSTNPNQSGGFAFFVDNEGADGYFIKIETTATAASSKQKEFKILKIKGGAVYELEDSQINVFKSLNGVYGGKTYKIDVRVEVSSGRRDIYVYVNGFKITAVDINPTSTTSVNPKINVLPVTGKVAMLCFDGIVYFDYVYGMHLTKEQFDQENLFNIYDGQFSNATLSFLYGNKTLNNNALANQTVNGFIEEFGCVAREVRVLKTKYKSRPAFPLYASTGINSFAKIIGQRLTSFGAEVYVVNNSGTFIPLDDSEYYSFYILGNYISQSGVLEYVDNAAGEYSVQEPVIFESRWIQKNTDVVALANWIKNIWSVKQTIVDMEVFGNPLISVGDIITINYPYNQLTTSRKFVVTNVNHSFRGGLNTSISCRTL